MSKRVQLTCDVLVVGAGPAGIASCVSAARSGARVILVDDNPLPGGQIWRAEVNKKPHFESSSRDARRWLGLLRECGASLLLSTRVVARLSNNLVIAENEREALEIHFSRAVLATGARELVLPFPGWTLPNVFAAGGLQALVKSGLSIQRKRIVVTGTGPLLIAVAAFFKSKCAHVEGIYEQCSWNRMIRFGASVLARPVMLWSALGYGANLRGSALHCGWWPVSAQGDECVNSLTVTNGKQAKTIECDMIACGFHLVPNTELQSAFGCELADDKVKVDEWQRTSEDLVFSVGESTGVGGLDLALIEGQIAGLAATGKKDEAVRFFSERRALEKMARAMDHTFALRPELRNLARPDTIVCRCEDVPWSMIQRQPSLRPARLHTRCSMGACQGRICGSALKFLVGWKSELTRPPVYPVRLSTLIQEPQAIAKEKP